MQHRPASTRPLARASICVLAAALFLVVFGCEAIVNGQIAPFPRTCSGTDLGGCPPGEYCKGAGCTTCETRDICDGYDNDCNGKVDDGPLSDNDADGYSFCGHVDAESGRLTEVDCDDRDPSIAPNMAETCNGKDDDCDGIVDNADKVCPGQTCLPKTGECTGRTCDATTCPPPSVCDPSTLNCVKPNGGLGDTCTGDRACTSGLCGDQAILGLGAGHCTKPCCSSFDCDAGFVCFGAGTGGNYCVSPDLLARGALGTATAGALCTTGSNCRSGVCTNGRCEDTCCSDAQCGSGTACTLTSFSGRTTFACLPPPGPVSPNATCETNSDCRSGVCAQYTDGFFTYPRCAAPCCGSAQCGSFAVAGAQVPTVCFDEPNARPGGTVPLCDEPKQGSGNGRVGDPCTSNGDCQSDRCTARFCTDVCCVDADCARAGWVCRPAKVGSGTYLRCQPAP